MSETKTLICPEDCWVPLLGRDCREGETIEMSSDIAEMFLAQPLRGWKLAKETPKTKTGDDK